MQVAVTGASGHVGANLVRALLARGARVRVLVHSQSRALEGLEIEQVKGCVTDPDAVRALVDGAERVFHLAAKISLDPRERPLMNSINIGGPKNVVEACKKAGVSRLVHFSSIHAYSSEPFTSAIDEDRPLASGDRLLPYDATKSAGERIVRDAIEAGLDAVIVNPTAILGPHDYGPSHMGEVILDLYHGRMPGLVVGSFDWVDVRDIVDGALLAAERAPRGARYLLTGHRWTVPELAKIVEKVTGRRSPRLVSPMWLARAVAPFAVAYARVAGRRPLFTPASLTALRNHRDITSARAARELGYSARPTEVTIRDTFDWLRAEGKLS
jgi:dihydroflavonol-4-reductase